METEASRVADELSRAYDGDPWHGLPMIAILGSVTAEEAAAHPLASAKSIWETLLHVTAWVRSVGDHIERPVPKRAPGWDWPAVTETGEAAWIQAKIALAQAHQALLRRLETFPDERIGTRVGAPFEDPTQADGLTFYLLLHGLVQHNVYHSAQIATMHRVLIEGRRA